MLFGVSRATSCTAETVFPIHLAVSGSFSSRCGMFTEMEFCAPLACVLHEQYAEKQGSGFYTTATIPSLHIHGAKRE